ncbi:MAG: NTP transferase domain-containing protein [Ignavibacteria bacterium]|nr:NTP transferase domain-containing protein [Bacteroidota bacterium]MBL7127352.1 NTP transferase domain-containing protein [Ignavibacteria bacterium]
MEEFLGILFCGGRGTRLGELTNYISKSFIPIYDKPVFKYGLELLERSKVVEEIVLLTNTENDERLNTLGYKTIIQDADFVTDMFSGWEYIKEKTKTKKNGVLVPSDNISNVKTDGLINDFVKHKADIGFSLFIINDKVKLSQMGCYNVDEGKYYYKSNFLKTNKGVIAPFIVRNNIRVTDFSHAVVDTKVIYREHNGYWFDIGDKDSILEASKWREQRVKGKR